MVDAARRGLDGRAREGSRQAADGLEAPASGSGSVARVEQRHLPSGGIDARYPTRPETLGELALGADGLHL